MANLFGTKNNTPVNAPQGNIYAEKYNKGIHNLLLVVGFTVINILLLVTNANTYFLFSAFVPYLLADYGMYYTGMYPEDYYYEAGSAIILDKSYLIIMLVIAAGMFFWVFARFLNSGLVENMPTLIVSGFIAMAALQAIFAGMILSDMVTKNRRDFETGLYEISAKKRKLCKEIEDGQ